MTNLRRKRIWNIADFAEWTGVSHKQAKAVLFRLDAELNGQLLRKSKGQNRGYWFFPSLLAKSKPEVFERIESLEARVEELEEQIVEARRERKIVVAQVGSNTRDIERLRSRVAATPMRVGAAR